MSAGFGAAPGLEQWEPPIEESVVFEPGTVQLEDFYAVMTTHTYLFAPTGEMWAPASVNARIPPIATGRKKKNGDEIFAAPSAWLDRHRPVEQLTWLPGEPQVIRGRVLADGGWIEREGHACYNLYRAPVPELGDASKATRWRELLRQLYGAQAYHLERFFAHRVQKPGEKINHAAVLGGAQGIGKDSILLPVKRRVGHHNVAEIGPYNLLGRFNGFAKSVIMHLSETRDLGDGGNGRDRYAFYEHSKVYIASPPDVLRVDEKNLREHYIPNVCGVIITTNHASDGLYLPADDRRHFVCWSECTKEDFSADYWRSLYQWYEAGGYGHVGAYLADLDLSDFDPKAPPPKTAAFWRIVDASRAPEDAELADALDRLGQGDPIVWPDAVTLYALAEQATGEFAAWLRDRRNSRQVPHRLESVGYVPVRHDGAKDGLWKIGRRGRVTVYARADLSLPARVEAARGMGEEGVSYAHGA